MKAGEQDERLDELFITLMAGGRPPAAPLSAEGSAALLVRILDNWQVLPALSADLVEGELAGILSTGDHARLARARLAVSAFEKAQIVGCAPFLAALDDHEIRYSLLKGAAAACLIYPERHMRAAWDFDLGVAWDDAPAAEALALQSGFHQAQRDPDLGRFYRADRELRAIVEDSHFELGFLARRLEVINLPLETKAAIREESWTHQFWHDADTDLPWCYAVVDIHHKLSLDIELGGLLASAWRKTGSDWALSVPDPAWFGAHLIFKLYWEGVHQYGKGLYQYQDLIRLLPMLDEAAFARLRAVLEHHHLVAAGYHVLKHVSDFGLDLPPHIESFVCEARTPASGTDPIETNDLGDVWPKLWGRR
jgi:hypothetical protein